MTRSDPRIRSYYEKRAEESRLERGLCQIEAVRTRSLIERLAPAPPGVVIDVGGAAGAYALWLADVLRLAETFEREPALLGMNPQVLALAGAAVPRSPT